MAAANPSSAFALRRVIVPSKLPNTNPLPAYKTFRRSSTAVLIPAQPINSTVFRLPLALSLVVHSSISSILSGIWDSILRAVPKKKTSHRKKRQRFLAGKALKDVTNLNTCSACGQVKRAHLLCPYCVAGRPCKPLLIQNFTLIEHRDSTYVEGQ